MRKFLLYSSALALLSGVAEAACIQTPTCSSLGYTSTSSCTGGTKCPFGNYWNCTAAESNNKITELTNKITELETQITELQKEVGTSNCQVGDILYSDMSCNPNIVSGKTPIGVVFDRIDKRAIALETKNDLEFADAGIDLSSMPSFSNEVSAKQDWNGKENTTEALNICKTNIYNLKCPALEYVTSYKTEGTKAGDWYLPSAGEMNAIFLNKEILNTTLKNLQERPIQSSDSYWTSTLKNSAYNWILDSNNRGFDYDLTYSSNNLTRAAIAF